MEARTSDLHVLGKCHHFNGLDTECMPPTLNTSCTEAASAFVQAAGAAAGPPGPGKPQQSAPCVKYLDLHFSMCQMSAKILQRLQLLDAPPWQQILCNSSPLRCTDPADTTFRQLLTSSWHTVDMFHQERPSGGVTTPPWPPAAGRGVGAAGNTHTGETQQLGETITPIQWIRETQKQHP